MKDANPTKSTQNGDRCYLALLCKGEFSALLYPCWFYLKKIVTPLTLPHSDAWYTFIRQPHAKSNNDVEALDDDVIVYSEGSRGLIPEE